MVVAQQPEREREERRRKTEKEREDASALRDLKITRINIIVSQRMKSH